MDEQQLINELEEDIDTLEQDNARLKALLDRVFALVEDDLPRNKRTYADAVKAIEDLLA